MGFSYLNEILQQENKLRCLSFRPLTGTLLSKQLTTAAIKKMNYGFRPLTGTLLSKHHPPILPPQAAFFAGLRGK